MSKQDKLQKTQADEAEQQSVTKEDRPEASKAQDQEEQPEAAQAGETDKKEAEEADNKDEKSDDEEAVKKKKKRRMWTIIRYAAIVACFAVIAYEAYNIISHEMENRRALNEYDSINDNYVQVLDRPAATPGEGDTGEAEEVDTETYPNLVIDFDGLAEINPDFIGWLYFPAVELSYPVVQEKRVDEYLRKTFQGTYNGNGAVFMDIISNPKFQGLNNILFAHHMINKSMFGILPTLAEDDNYKKLDEDPYFYIYTKDAVYRYYVYGFYGSAKDGVVYDDVGNDKQKYDEIARYIRENNMYTPKEPVNFGEYPELLQLSTCYYTEHPRFIVGGAKDHAWYTSEDGVKSAEERYQELREECVTVKEGANPADIQVSVDTDKLNEINADNAGWLYFPALEISYPIAVEKKQYEYRKRTFFGDNDSAGSLYIDMNSNAMLGGYSNMLFGHSLANGTMLDPLEQVVTDEAAQLQADPYFYIINEKGTYKYKTVACWTGTSSDAVYTIVKGSDEMKTVVEHIKSVNILINGEELTEMDYTRPAGMMTLVTCPDFTEKTRTFLTGVLVEGPEEE